MLESEAGHTEMICFLMERGEIMNDSKAAGLFAIGAGHSGIWEEL